MKNWLKKCSVALLIFSMIGTTMPVYAADAPAAKTQTTTEDQTEEQKSEVQAEEPQVEEPQQQEQTSEEQQSVDENVEGEQDVQEQEAPEQETTEQEAQPEESSMNYAYVESPYLQTPETQRIVVSWGTEDEYIEQMVLHVRKDDDTWEDWCISRSEGNLYLFEKYYEDEYQSGTYEVVSISVTENGETTDYALTDLGMEAKFGVNQEYDGIDELQPVDEEQEEAAAEDAVGISVSTLNEDGTIEEQNSIEDALDAARTDVLASTPAMMSLDDDSGISTQAARSGKIVVALDPGHDDRDAGASYYGLREEALTLKIANYCKEELEKYAGVEVYMTRTSSKCPYPNESPAGGCITARANAAAKAGAKIFVSFHLNAASSAAKGAEVIIPNYNWKSEVGAQGRELATKILNELSSIGLYNRGLYYKTGTDPKYKYPDGSLEDWFTVQVANKYNGIPGIIVEHAFLTNSGDVNNFLNSEAGLKKLGVADATGIAKYLGLTKTGERVNVEEGTYVFSSALNANKVLSIQNDGFGDQTAAVLNDKKDTSGQRFEIRSAGNGYYTITAEHSGKVLDVAGGSTASGTIVQQFTANGTDAQLWYFTDAGNGDYTIHSVLGNCLDVWNAGTSNGTKIDCFEYNGTNAQKWKLTKTESKPLENGTYSITNSSTNKVLSVNGSSTADSANICVGENQNLASQRFELTYISNGYYKMIAEHSGKSLDVDNGSSNNGTNLKQYTYNQNNAQLWKFVKLSDGSYYIRSKLGTVVGVERSSINVNMQSINQSGAEKWKFAKTENKPLKDGEYIITSASAIQLVATESNENVQLDKFTESENQKYEITYVSNGYYKISEAATKKVLDVYNGSTAPGTNIQTYDWNGSDAQLWKFVNAGNGSYYIRSKLGLVADIANGAITSGTNIQAFNINYTNAQKWVISANNAGETEESIKEGVYIIRNMADGNQVLDVQNESMSNGSNIQIYNEKNVSGQRFKISYVGNGYYKIISDLSGKVLDVSNGSKEEGANIQAFIWNGSDAQLWKFVKATDGSCYIVSKTGKILGLNQNKAVAGANVQTAINVGNSAQKWKLESKNDSIISNGTYYIRSSNTSKLVMDINDGSTKDGANVQIYDFNGTDAQQFEITYISDGYCKIVAKNSGKTLEYNKSTSVDGANVYQNKWKGTENQLWKIIIIDGNYYFQSKVGGIIEVQGGILKKGINVQTYSWNGTNAQKWKLIEVNESSGVNIPEGTYMIQSVANDSYVLDIDNGDVKDGANVQLFKNNNTWAQKYIIKSVGNGYYKIQSKATGKVLDVTDESMYSGINVQQFSWNGSAAQCWKFVDDGTGNYYIKSKLGTVLEIQNGVIKSGSNIQTYALNETIAQKWKFTKIDEYVDVKEGIYTVQSALSDNKVLDIANGSTENGANLQIFDKNGTMAQNFEIKLVSDKEYEIISQKSGKALDVAGGSSLSGTNVWQYDRNNSNAQRWHFVNAGNGYYYIESNLGTVLDVSNGDVKNGTNVQAFSCNQSSAQQWKLVECSKNSELYSIMGTTSTTVSQMVNFFNDKGGKYPYYGNSVAPTIKDFCKIYIDECNIEGVKAEVAFSQAMMETGFLRFGGDVKKEQYNFAGLGATGGGNPGNSFESIRIGIRAQVQHLKAYASTEGLKQTCVDGRYKYVTKGVAPYVEWLGQKENPTGAGWATGVNYGYNIVNLYINPLLNTNK